MVEDLADYDRVAGKWTAARRKHWPSGDSDFVGRFVKGLPKGARVLDLGCGMGVPIAAILVDSGAQVVGIDRSEKLLEFARDQVPDAEFIFGDVVGFDIEHAFSGVVLWDVLFHIERQEHRSILKNIYDHLLPGGRLIVTTGGSENPPFTDTMFEVEFFYDSHPPQRFLDISKEVGFQVIQSVMLDEPDGGRNKGRMGVLLSRP
jgi:SAM-dependent methyltransferase